MKPVRRHGWPSIGLVLILLALWLLLNNTLAIGHGVMGVLLAVGVPWVAWRWRQEVLPLSDTADAAPNGSSEGEGATGTAQPARRHNGWHRGVVALRLVLRVLADIVTANLAVARRIVFVPETHLKPGWVCIELRLHSPGAMAALAAIATLTPGTVSADLLPPQSRGGAPRLLVHALDMPDAQALAAEIRTRYETPLLEMLQ